MPRLSTLTTIDGLTITVDDDEASQILVKLGTTTIGTFNYTKTYSTGGTNAQTLETTSYQNALNGAFTFATNYDIRKYEKSIKESVDLLKTAVNEFEAELATQSGLLRQQLTGDATPSTTNNVSTILKAHLTGDAITSATNNVSTILKTAINEFEAEHITQSGLLRQQLTGNATPSATNNVTNILNAHLTGNATTSATNNVSTILKTAINEFEAEHITQSGLLRQQLTGNATPSATNNVTEIINARHKLTFDLLTKAIFGVVDGAALGTINSKNFDLKADVETLSYSLLRFLYERDSLYDQNGEFIAEDQLQEIARALKGIGVRMDYDSIKSEAVLENVRLTNTVPSQSDLIQRVNQISPNTIGARTKAYKDDSHQILNLDTNPDNNSPV